MVRISGKARINLAAEKIRQKRCNVEM